MRYGASAIGAAKATPVLQGWGENPTPQIRLKTDILNGTNAFNWSDEGCETEVRVEYESSDLPDKGRDGSARCCSHVSNSAQMMKC